MTHSVTVSVDEQLVLTERFKRNLFIAIGIGLFLFLVGAALLALGIGSEHAHEGADHVVEAVSHHETGATHHEGVEAVESSAHHGPTWMTRVWAVLWQHSVYFTGISVIGLFFVCVNYVSWSGWSVLIKRIPEAVGSFIPYGGGMVLLVFLLGHHDLFHWTHHELYEVGGPEYDSVMAGKTWYLNMPFFISRMILYIGLWYFCWIKIRRYSLQEDLIGGDTNYNKSGFFSPIFLIIFGISSSMAAWDWVMSINSHWFSTMFGWYVFASWWVSGMAVITLICIILKENGYLKAVNESHFHDLGKYIFAFSIFWTYIWFSQFLLIYYSNLPEETTYFIERLKGFDGHYTGFFYFNLIINFFFPFLALMTRDSKRKIAILKVVTIAVILGHWLDFYMMIMPATTKGTSGIGLLEIGTMVVFTSCFILIVTNTLAKAKLIPAKHPMLEESLHHNI